MMGNNHKTALHDFIWCVFSAVLFYFCMVDRIPGFMDLYAAGLWSGTGFESYEKKDGGDAWWLLTSTAAASFRAVPPPPPPSLRIQM